MSSAALDKAGATASLVCAVHCVALPLAIALLPALGLAWLDNPWIDRSFLVAAVLFAVLAHPKGYVQHKRCVPASLALLGIVGIILAISVWERVEAHHYAIAAGGLLVAGSHWLNRHYCHQACCDGCRTNKQEGME